MIFNSPLGDLKAINSVSKAAGNLNKSNTTVPGQTAPLKNKETTPQIPDKGKTLTLVLTPKKKQRFTGKLATDNIPALQLGLGKITTLTKSGDRLFSSIFSDKGALATNNQNRIRNRIKEQLNKISSIQQARSEYDELIYTK
ncbi:hypothetical protein V8C40DRAFT_248363 [Trichoderma camerunense]